MAALIKNTDPELYITTVESGISYFYVGADKPCEEDEYLGDDFTSYCEDWKEYNDDILKAETLEELCAVLNSRTDTFGDGGWYSVK